MTSPATNLSTAFNLLPLHPSGRPSFSWPLADPENGKPDAEEMGRGQAGFLLSSRSTGERPSDQSRAGLGTSASVISHTFASKANGSRHARTLRATHTKTPALATSNYQHACMRETPSQIGRPAFPPWLAKTTLSRSPSSPKCTAFKFHSSLIHNISKEVWQPAQRSFIDWRTPCRGKQK